MVMFERITKIKSHLSSKRIWAGIGFLAGLILGYILGIFKVHTFFPLPEISINFSWLNWFGDVTPNPIFLSDVAAFQAVIIAFLVPLSIEIISKISERYNSDVIIHSFENNWWNKILPPFILVNIAIAIVLRFLVSDDIDTMAWKIIAWIILLIFLFIAFAVWRVIERIKRFMRAQSVINQLYEDVERSVE